LQARPRSSSEEPENSGAASNNGSHASLGITGVTVDTDLAKELNLNQSQDGVLIEQIEQNSAADEAGLHGSFKTITINGSRVLVGGDVITAANGEAIHSIQDLQTIIAQAKPGDKMTLTILRDGREQQITVTLGERSN